jgi:hypothetical protein
VLPHPLSLELRSRDLFEDKRDIKRLLEARDDLALRQGLGPPS